MTDVIRQFSSVIQAVVIARDRAGLVHWWRNLSGPAGFFLDAEGSGPGPPRRSCRRRCWIGGTGSRCGIRTA